MSDGTSPTENDPRPMLDILPLLDDHSLFLQEGLLTIDGFINECKSCGLGVSEEELEYYEERGLLFPLLRIARSVTWVSADGGRQFDLDEGATPPDGARPLYNDYATFGEALVSLRDEHQLQRPYEQSFVAWRSRRDSQTNQDTVATYYVGYQVIAIHWLRQKLILETTYRRPEPEDEYLEKVVNVLLDRFKHETPERLQRQVAELTEIVALLLAIQNRYRPEVTGLLTGYPDINEYYKYVDTFNHGNCSGGLALQA